MDREDGREGVQEPWKWISVDKFSHFIKSPLRPAGSWWKLVVAATLPRPSRPVTTCAHFRFWLLAAVSSQRVCVGFSRCCLRVRAETGFTALSIQRASARASCYRVTKQTRPCSAQPVGTVETLPQERDPVTGLVVHLLDESGAILIVTSRLPA